MIQTRTRKILNDLWERKIRTLLASVSIFIGVFGVVALSSAGEILVNQLEEDLQQDKLAMLRSSVIVSNTSEVDNEAVLSTLRQQEGVTAVEGRAIYPLFWSLEAGDDFEEGIIVAHSEPFADSQLEPARLIEGRFPEITEDEGHIEIAIERRMADKYELEIGDSITLRVLSTPANNGIQSIPAEIVGIAFQPYGYTGIEGQVSAEELVFAAYDDAAQVAGFKGFRSFYVRFEDYETTEAQQSAFLGAFAETPYAPTYTQVEDPAQNPTIESTRTTNNLLIILALSALVVSGFLIVNLISAIVSEQRRQIGLLKAIGATTADNVYIYLGTAFAYGLLGTVPGVLLGLPAGYFIAQGLAIQSQTVIDTFSVSVFGLLLGISVGLAVPVLAAIFPVFTGIRVKILEAMTDMGIDSNFGKSRLDRMIGNLPLPLTFRQAVRNSYQKRYRLILTGITLMLASAAFVGIFAVFSSLTGIVEAAFETNGNEISVSPNEGQEFDRVASLLQENVDDIESVDPASTLAIEVEGYDPGPVQAGPPGLFAVGFNTANPDILNLDYVSGSGWKDDPAREGVVISASIAEAIGKDVGDSVTLTGGGNTETFDIIGVANYPADAVWMDWERLARFGGIVDAQGNPFPNQIDVSLKGKELSPDDVDDAIAEMNEVLLANGISSRFQNQVELAELITTIVTFFGVILSLAAFLIALVGVVGLLTTLSLSVFERQKEIGVMRSVGAGSGVIVQQFLFEGLIVGLVSWAIAAPLSYLFSRGLISALPFGGTYELSYPLTALAVGLVGMVFIVSLASIVPSLSAARKTVSDILRYQ